MILLPILTALKPITVIFIYVYLLRNIKSLLWKL